MQEAAQATSAEVAAQKIATKKEALDERIAKLTTREQELATAMEAADAAYEKLSAKAIAAGDKGKELAADELAAYREADRASDQAFAQHFAATTALRKAREERERLNDPRVLHRMCEEEAAKQERFRALRERDPATPRARRSGPNVLDAAVAVLEAAPGGMHYREVTKAMRDAGWQPRGKTPEATVNAALAVAAKKGERVERIAPGIFKALNPTKETK